MERYRPKIDWWFHLAMGMFVVFMAALYVLAARSQPPVNATCALAFLLMAAFFLLFLLPAYLLTCYTFEADGLRIRSGLTRGKKIAYHDIVSCLPASGKANMSAALSKERLTVTYRAATGNKTIHISPKDKGAFLGELALRKKG